MINPTNNEVFMPESPLRRVQARNECDGPAGERTIRRAGHFSPRRPGVPDFGLPAHRGRLTMTVAVLALVLTQAAVAGADEYAFDVTVTLDPDAECQPVRIEVEQDSRLLREMDWEVDESRGRWRGEPEPETDGERMNWQPASDGGWLSYCVDLDHRRRGDGYDSRVAEDFALFRGDDLVPAARTRTAAGAKSRTTLEFELPDDWSVVTRYREVDDDRFLAADPDRRFDRPTGWMVAGDLGVRRDRIADVRVAIAGPVDYGIRRMDLMAFLNFLMPEFEMLMPQLPERLVIVSAGDPLWRGGLSGPDSLYLHADRPVISGNGTSTLIHELIHVFMGAYGGPDDDWLSEGLAEFYAIELMYRAGGMTDARRDRAWRHLEDWGEDVERLRGVRAGGPVKARSAVFLRDLDEALRDDSDHSLDDILAGLTRHSGPLTLAGLREVCDDLEAGDACDVLDSDLLRLADDDD